jgi:hypothetical protein
MGGILEAHCACGFESGHLLVGGGMLTFHEICHAPAVCLRCNIFLMKNYMKKYSKCPECNKKVVFYNDPSVQMEFVSSSHDEEDQIFSWYLDEERGHFDLPKTTFFCPNCKNVTLKFRDIGNWD